MRNKELTTREIEPLQLISEGYTHQEMMGKLFISRAGLDYRITILKGKLGARSIAHAVAIGIHKGIINTNNLML